MVGRGVVGEHRVATDGDDAEQPWAGQREVVRGGKRHEVGVGGGPPGHLGAEFGVVPVVVVGARDQFGQTCGAPGHQEECGAVGIRGGNNVEAARVALWRRGLETPVTVDKDCADGVDPPAQLVGQVAVVVPAGAAMADIGNRPGGLSQMGDLVDAVGGESHHGRDSRPQHAEEVDGKIHRVLVLQHHAFAGAQPGLDEPGRTPGRRLGQVAIAQRAGDVGDGGRIRCGVGLVPQHQPEGCLSPQTQFPVPRRGRRGVGCETAREVAVVVHHRHGGDRRLGPDQLVRLASSARVSPS